MCGYACVNCGRCKGEAPAFSIDLENVPGYCAACGTINGPLDEACGECGAALDGGTSSRRMREAFLKNLDETLSKAV